MTPCNVLYPIFTNLAPTALFVSRCTPTLRAVRASLVRLGATMELTTRGTARKIELHGKTKTPEYMAWKNILARCRNPKTHMFYRYGGRGITICKEWENSFLSFLDHVGTRPTPSHSIDRINSNGNYEPGNMRWSTRKEQQQNMGSNRSLTFCGETLVMSEWARRLNIPASTIKRRLDYGLSVEKALTYGQHRGWYKKWNH